MTEYWRIYLLPVYLGYYDVSIDKEVELWRIAVTLLLASWGPRRFFMDNVTWIWGLYDVKVGNYLSVNTEYHLRRAFITFTFFIPCIMMNKQQHAIFTSLKISLFSNTALRNCKIPINGSVDKCLPKHDTSMIVDALAGFREETYARTASKYILSLKVPVKLLSKCILYKKTNHRLVSLNKRKESDKYKEFLDSFCPTSVLAAAPSLLCIGCESRHNYCTNLRQSCCVMTSYILPLTSSPTPPRHINVVWRLKSCLELLHPLIGSIRGEHSSWRHERVSYFTVQATDMYLLIEKWPPLILVRTYRLLVDWNKKYCRILLPRV